MRQPKVSVGFTLHVITTQRLTPADCLGVCHLSSRAGLDTQPHTHHLERKHLQSIGVYVSNFFGQSVRFRILKDLGSTKSVACVAEIVYPEKFFGIRVGIPWSVIRGVV